MNNKTMTIAPIVVVAILIIMMTTPLLTQQSVSANKGHGTFNGPIVPTTINGDGTTTTECIKNCDLLSSSNNAPAASTAKSESASSARSDNNVKCFAFCLGISNANSGSAADSNSRTNSPGNTASALPVSPQSTTTTTVGRPFSASFPVQSPGIACLDISGSVQDQGYSKGYVDGNRDSAGLNGHGFDSSLHGNHTPEFTQGYNDGYRAGWSDGKNGINQNPC